MRRHANPQRGAGPSVFLADEGVIGVLRFQVYIVVVGPLEEAASPISVSADEHGVTEADVHVARHQLGKALSLGPQRESKQLLAGQTQYALCFLFRRLKWNFDPVAIDLNKCPNCRGAHEYRS